MVSPDDDPLPTPDDWVRKTCPRGAGGLEEHRQKGLAHRYHRRTGLLNCVFIEALTEQVEKEFRAP